MDAIPFTGDTERQGQDAAEGGRFGRQMDHGGTFSDRPMKRQRARVAIKLSDLPIEAMAMIMRHIHPSFPTRDRPSPTEVLRSLAGLRTLSRLFRDAFDAHIISLNLCDVTGPGFAQVLTTILPRFRNLTSLALPMCSLEAELLPHWQHFFTNSRARLQHLIFAHGGDSGTAVVADLAIVTLVASACRDSLEQASTNSPVLLSAIGQHPRNVHTLHVIMDDVQEAVLQPFTQLRSLFLLYRRRLARPRAHALAETLRRVGHGALHVHLRMNQVECADFALFPLMRGLHKLSLFDGTIGGDGRGVAQLAACAQLEDIVFEHMAQLTGAHIAALATTMRHRLKWLRIWHCDRVTDEGLLAVAEMCPGAEVDLQFCRDQYSLQALAALGDRVSWGSYAF